jgi:hypothetical protein
MEVEERPDAASSPGSHALLRDHQIPLDTKTSDEWFKIRKVSQGYAGQAYTGQD